MVPFCASIQLAQVSDAHHLVWLPVWTLIPWKVKRENKESVYL
jgi:hypothetical protein